MCVMSMVMQTKTFEWQGRYWQQVPVTPPLPLPDPVPAVPAPTAEEMAFLRRLMEAAKVYDAENGEPDCELGEKKDLLREMAKKLGVEIHFVE